MATLYTLVSATTGFEQLEDTPLDVTSSALTVDGTVGATGGTSTKWNSTYTEVNTYSADWNYVATNSAASNAFQTIAIVNAGADSDTGDIVADSRTDVLTLCAGTNIDIFTNTSTDTITISARNTGEGETNEFSFKTITVSAQDATVSHQSDVVADTTTDTLTLCAGPNIALITDPTTDTISISSRDTDTGEANEFSFKTIAVSGTRSGGDIIADTSTDTLILCAGSNIEFISDPTTDTITISSIGGTGTADTDTIQDLSEVSSSSGDWNYTASNSSVDVSFYVTNNGSDHYSIKQDGLSAENDPALHLKRGLYYRFRVNATGHPFWIKTATGTGTDNQFNRGVTNNGAETGNVDFIVPHSCPRKLYYQCENHSNLVGVINISDETASTSLAENSGNWDNTYSHLNSTSANWQNTYTTVNSNSSSWANESSFKTISVDGQSDIVADTTTDTLSVVAGSNVTLTTDATNDKLTIAATDTDTTYTAGSGLELYGTEFSHEDTSSQASINGSGQNFIQDIILDDYGHITSMTAAEATGGGSTFDATDLQSNSGNWDQTYTTVNSNSSTWTNESSFKTISVDGQSDIVADTTTDTLSVVAGSNVTITTDATNDKLTITATDTDTTYTAGSGLELYGTEFSHEDTSSQSSVDNSGNNFIQDITLDAYGHITGLTSAEASDTNTVFDATDLQSNSGNWDQTYTTVNSNSSSWSSYSFSTIALSSKETGAAIGNPIAADSSTDALVLSAGPGISLLSDPTTDAITISAVAQTAGGSGGGESNQNAFSTIKVDGQSDIAADTTTDSLSVVAGSNITLTTDATNDKLTIAATDTDTTYTAGSGIELYGTEFSHEDTSSQASVNNSGQNFIQDIALDEYGHITSLTSAEATGSTFDATDLQSNSGNWDQTYTTVNSNSSTWTNESSFKTISVDGQSDIVADTTTDTLSVVAGSNVTITTRAGDDVITFAATDTDTTYTAASAVVLEGTVFGHENTSSQASVNNSGQNFIQDITLDEYGHITGLTSAEATGGSTFDATDLQSNSGNWDQTYTTVNSNSSTWSTAVSGGIALVGTTVHLADPETLTQIAEADTVGSDRMLIWDESVSSWKYITIEDLQDEIDTTGGGTEAVATDTQDIYTSFSTDTYYPKVELLLHFEGTNGDRYTYDDSIRARTVAMSGALGDMNGTAGVNDAHLSSAQKKFGSTSLSLTGSDSHISINGMGDGGAATTSGIDDFYIGANDFTIEGWWYFTEVSEQHVLISKSRGGGTSNSSWLIWYDPTASNGILSFYVVRDGESNWSHAVSTRTTNPISINTWHHVAVSRVDGTAKIFVDGTGYALQADTTALFSDEPISESTRDIIVGRQEQADGFNFDGYVDEVRITIGHGRYTSNFTPSTVAFSGESRYQQTVVTGVSGAGTLTEVQSNSGNWDQTYTTVNSNSSSWSNMDNWILEDGDGTEVTVSDGKEVKFVEGGGIDINWTDTSTGSDGDPYDLTFTILSAQTDIKSLLAADIKIGEDDQTKIDFETADEIHFYANNVHQIKLVDNAFTPQADSDVDLGASGTYWKDAYIDTITTTGNLTIGGDTVATGQISATDGFASRILDLGTHSGNGVLTFDVSGPSLQTVVLKANMTNTYLGATIEQGKSVTVRLSACGGDRTLAFHDTMKFVGGKPSSIASGKVGLLSITTFGPLCAAVGTTDVVASYAVED